MLHHLFERYRDQNLTSEELKNFRALPFGEVEHLLRLHPPGTQSLIDVWISLRLAAEAIPILILI